MSNIGNNIKKLRSVKKLNQTAFADEALLGLALSVDDKPAVLRFVTPEDECGRSSLCLNLLGSLAPVNASSVERILRRIGF